MPPIQALNPITRTDFQALSRLRIREAEVLLANECFEGAFYLAGYAVECGLKACICAAQVPGHFPPKPDVATKMYSHRLPDLLGLSGLETMLAQDRRANPSLDASWGAALTWSEQSRYAMPGQTEAQALYDAVADPRYGVLEWLARHW